MFPCGFGAKNGEQESKTVQKMGHFLVLVTFFARPKLKISFLVVPWSFFAPSLKKTFATKAACFNSCKTIRACASAVVSQRVQRFFSLYHNARTPLAFLSSSKFSWWNNNSSLKFTIMGVKELEQCYCTTCKFQACGRQACALCAPRLAVDNFTGFQPDNH